MAVYQPKGQPGAPTYLVDATATIFRGYFGSKPLKGVDGTPTHAVFGFTQILMKFLREKRPASALLTFDAGPISFRNDIYKDYKANRGAPPPDLLPQFDLCIEAGKALGFAVAIAPGYEADDIMATVAYAEEKRGHSVSVVTVDKDLCQLISPKVTLLDPSRGTETTVEDVVRRFSIGPKGVPDWLALVGDASDNIPGVPGVGARTASALLERFESLEAIYENLDKMDEVKVRGRSTLGAKLEAAKETAFMARELATVRRDVPLTVDPKSMVYRGARVGEFEALFESWGFAWLANRVVVAPE